jgi:plasmid stabilization system protein ParE
MNYEFLPEARAEFEQAVAYYDQCGLGLGDEFTNEVEAAIRRVLTQPEAWSPYHHGTRRCLTQRFPYSVVYQIRPNLILVVAVAHLRREPGYWTARLASPR